MLEGAPMPGLSMQAQALKAVLSGASFQERVETNKTSLQWGI
jgi:hypothetical protein